MSYPEGSLSLVGGKPHLENWVLFQAPHFTGKGYNGVHSAKLEDKSYE